MSGGDPAATAGSVPDEDAWAAWTPWELAARMAGMDGPWCVTAGWAVDLFLGRQTREHEDLEVAIPSASWPLVQQQLDELQFVVAAKEGMQQPTPAALAEHFQTWGYDDTGVYRVDVFRDPHDGDMWICRRDPSLTRPYSALIRTTADGIPYMAPDVVLLFKAKHNRDKDQADLAACLPLLTDDERSWLAGAIERVYGEHPWLGLLR